MGYTLQTEYILGTLQVKTLEVLHSDLWSHNCLGSTHIHVALAPSDSVSLSLALFAMIDQCVRCDGASWR